MNLSDIKFNQLVNTPDGVGRVGGRTYDLDGVTNMIICTHTNVRGRNPHLVGKIRGIWYLGAYYPEALSPYREAS